MLLLADREAAEDALHDAFVQMARASVRKPGETLSFGYAATAVRNTCYSMLRRRRPDAGQPGLIEPISPDATEEERLMIDEALRALPVEQREVVFLKVYEGLTFQEIASRCDMGINTAASRYRYAMQALRRALAPGSEGC